MKRVLLLSLIFVLLMPGEAWAYTYGDPSLYVSLTVDNDDNNDGIVVYHIEARKGSKARYAWNHAFTEFNTLTRDNGNRGLIYVSHRNTDKPIELYAKGILPNGERRCSYGYAGIMERWGGAPDYTYFCEKMRGDTQSYFNFVADHEIGHGVGFEHRPCEYGNVSIMLGMPYGCVSTQRHVGPADIESFVYKFGNGGLLP